MTFGRRRLGDDLLSAGRLGDSMIKIDIFKWKRYYQNITITEQEARFMLEKYALLNKIEAEFMQVIISECMLY